MNKKYFIISLCSMLVAFTIGWMTARFIKNKNEFTGIVQAIPVVRFEQFDASRNILILGLFNPGTLPMEIDQTELIYQSNSNNPHFISSVRKYGDKPLVLDPGDTVLVPLRKNMPAKSQAESGAFWGKLEFRLPGKEDFYSLHHHFNTVAINKN